MDSVSRRAALVALVGGATGLGACGGGEAAAAAPAIGPIERLADDVRLVWAPRIADSPDGTQWLAWVEEGSSGQQVVATRVATSGAVTRWLIGAPAALAYAQQIVMAASGPVVTWLEDVGSGLQLRALAWNGQQWVDEQTWPAADGFFGEPVLVIAPDGTVALAWNETPAIGDSILWVALRAVGGAWSAASRVHMIAGQFLSTPQLAFDSTGRAIATWMEPPAGSDPNTRLAWAMLSVGGAWTLGGTLETGMFGLPRLVSPTAQTWVLVWPSVDQPDAVSLWSRRFVGAAWEPMARRIDTAADEPVRDLALDARAGVVQVAWTALITPALSTAVVRCSRIDLASGQWAPPLLVFTAPSVQPVLLRLRLQTDGRAALTWGYQGGDRSPWIATADPAGVWRTQHLDDDPVYSSNAPDLALSGDGWASAWYRYQDNDRLDVLLRRVR